MRAAKLFLCFCLVFAALPKPAGAQPAGPNTAGGLPLPLMLVLRQVNLTPAQQSKLHQIMETSSSQALPLMKQLHAIHEQIADKLLSTDALSATDITPLQQQETAIHQSLDQKMLATALQIRGLLTPEQLAKAADLHKRLKAAMAQIDAIMGGEPPMGPPPF